jgi:hypothetical protein
VTAFITGTECVYSAVRSAHTVYLCFYTRGGMCLLRGTFCRSCIFCGSENKQRLFHCTELSDWFLLPSMSVFSAPFVLSTQCISVFLLPRLCVYYTVRSAKTLYLWAIISLYSINWLVFITESEWVYWAVCFTHTIQMCFLWIWEQTAIMSLHSIKWLVFITEKECVYCAVLSAHTDYLYVFIS